MDTRDSPEQTELRRAAGRLARQLGPATVAGLDDRTRAERLAVAVTDAGWLELRDDGGEGEPLASGAETAIVADALGAAVADTAFAGPLLARDLARRAGIAPADGVVVAFTPMLDTIAAVADGATTAPLYAVDSAGATTAYVLVPEDSGFTLGELRAGVAGAPGTDLTRAVHEIPAGVAVDAIDGQERVLDDEDLAGWRALGLALTSADLVGVIRGVLAITVEYAAQRQQYGVPVGSFQAVQHLLAEAHCLMEGSASVARHASWAVDDLPPAEALDAGRVAKAYCARAARTVCETAVQVHGGIGNTWECIVHVYLRRALLSSQWFGDDGAQLRALADTRLGA
jgi:hypothetical protein